MTRVLVADDHAIVREGILRILALDNSLEVAGEAHSGWDVIKALGETSFDMLLMDMSMPGPSGVELIKRVRDTSPDLPILVLSVHDEPLIASRAIKAGARGYLTKDSDPQTILGGIAHVAAGGHVIDSKLATRMLFSSPVDEGQHPRELLTPREYEVFEGLARGQTMNRLAEALHLSPKTVSTHKHRLMKKLNIQTLTELVRIAIRYQVVSEEVLD